MPPFPGLDAFAALRGEGLRPELRALFERAATHPRHEVAVRSDGMVQSGPDPACADAPSPEPLEANRIPAAVEALRARRSI
jgi:hypothetical protein